MGPHPYPTLVRDFQAIIGVETRRQLRQLEGRLPDALIACVGGGSNAMGIFYPFSKLKAVKLIAVEAAGHGLDTGQHAAALQAGSPGILHGTKSYLLQNEYGQIELAHSISAGLDYPGVGPELSDLKQQGRLTLANATDTEALEACRWVAQAEGIIPALETSHAFAALKKLRFEKNALVVLNVSGRGDKDMETIAKYAF